LQNYYKIDPKCTNAVQKRYFEEEKLKITPPPPLTRTTTPFYIQMFYFTMHVCPKLKLKRGEGEYFLTGTRD
jgi:hypothetical protein